MGGRVRRTLRRSVTVAVVIAVASVGLTANPAQARVGTDDYPSRLRRTTFNTAADPWNFWNRQCTSFVAWRLNNDKDVGFHNYFLDVHWGDASNWASAARQMGIPVSQRARRGTVAWWSANSPGSTPGHVAWVTGVSQTAVTIEEYNYGTQGGYGRRTIARSSALYPEGFIAITQPRFRAVDKPSVTGVAQVGEVVRVDRGRWAPYVSGDYSYQWLIDGVPVPGATAGRLRLLPEHVGTRVGVQVTVRHDDVETGQRSTYASTRVQPGILLNETPPLVTGTAEVGQPLTASRGTWSRRATVTRQWLADGKPVRGATDRVFVPAPRHLGQRISVSVTGSRLGYTNATAASKATGAVVPGTLTRTVDPVVVGTPAVGAGLTVAPGDWPVGTRLAYQWRADGVDVPRATGSTYTPKAADLGKRLSVHVAATKKGYHDASATTAPSAAIDLGTLVATRTPAVQGTPRVGVPLTADPGVWSPRAAFAYQWLADGAAIAGATGRTFTPSADQLGDRIAVRVTASREAYRTISATTAGTTSVAPGRIASEERPTIAGTPHVGETLAASRGTWSLSPQSATYQWYSDETPIDGATGRTYEVRAADAGHRVTVRVTVGARGYTAATRAAKALRALHGAIGFEQRPAVTGSRVLGEVLRVDAGDLTVDGADVRVHWLRDGRPIRGADALRYRLRPADVGHAITARVVARKTDWAAAEREVGSRRDVRSVPRLRATPVTSGRTVRLEIRVAAPGLSSVRGAVVVRRKGHAAVTRAVKGGRATVRLGTLSRGRHRVVVRYVDRGRTVARQVVVRVRVR